MSWYVFVVSPLLFPSLLYLLPFGLLTLPFSPFMFLLCPPHGRNLGVTDPTFNHLFLIPDFSGCNGRKKTQVQPKFYLFYKVWVEKRLLALHFVSI